MWYVASSKMYPGKWQIGSSFNISSNFFIEKVGWDSMKNLYINILISEISNARKYGNPDSNYDLLYFLERYKERRSTAAERWQHRKLMRALPELNQETKRRM